jgi:hypothetical protein
VPRVGSLAAEADSVHPQRRGQVELGQFLVWFALVYGNLNALVVGVVFLSVWVGGSSGSSICADWGFGVTSCRVTLVGAYALVLCISTALSFKRLLDIRRRKDK